ncbi:MAG: 1-acyl-sn-glycerol-3-phosphate acyltransferase [Candidatus Marinimicrobia bacterium]|nr:1-acyl-sn-glycerol-3-phosphate acyltransferase [Candidatus Neomarinimicrobiota bacterium]
MTALEQPTWVYPFVRWLVRRAARTWLGVSVTGRAHLPAQGPYIVAANHVSFLDPPILGAELAPITIRFMARDTLMGNRFLRWLFRRLLCVPLDRTRGDLAALRRALDTLAQGGILGLFPEGTRSPDGALQPAKGGIGFLVAKAGVPVVPAYLDGTYQALPKGRRWPRRHPVTVRFGPPITPADISALGAGKTLYPAAAELIMQRIAALAPQ